MKTVFNMLDKLCMRWFKIEIDREVKFYPSRNKIEEIDQILHDMEAIDSKSGALLTHISIMFAVLSFFLNGSNNHFLVQILFLFEFIVYLVVAMILMRCIDIMGPPFRELPEDQESLKETYYFEITLRREIYHRALRTVYMLTAALIPIIIFKYAL